MEKLNELVEQAKKISSKNWFINSDEEVTAIDKDAGPDDSEEVFIGCAANIQLAKYITSASPETILAIAEALRAMEQRAEAAEAKLAELANKKPDIMVSSEGAEAIRAIMNREMSAAGRYVTLKRPSRIGEEGMMGIYIRPAPAADLVPIGRVDRGEVSDNNEYPNARVVCLHDQADWENFPDGTELFLRPAPAVGMDKPEPYAWLVHAPQGDYVERNPEVVAHLEGTGLTKCKPLYLDL